MKPEEHREEQDMDFKDLTDEQRAKARACGTPEELLALAREEGYELSDAELESVSGGSWTGCSKEKYGCGMVGH